MTSIQGGKVTYGRTVKTGEYENKRADVEITFNVDEGQDPNAALDLAASMALGKAHDILGMRASPAPKTVAASTAAPAGDKETAAAALNEADATKVKTPKPPKATKAAEKPKDDELPTDPPATEPKADAPKADDLGDEWAAEQPEITDAQLTSEASRKNQELQKTHAGAAPAMIRKLIGEFVGAGKQMKDIEQPKRAEFVRRLKELK
jgi:hypothetical protein